MPGRLGHGYRQDIEKTSPVPDSVTGGRLELSTHVPATAGVNMAQRFQTQAYCTDKVTTYHNLDTLSLRKSFPNRKHVVLMRMSQC